MAYLSRREAIAYDFALGRLWGDVSRGVHHQLVRALASGDGNSNMIQIDSTFTGAVANAYKTSPSKSTWVIGQRHVNPVPVVGQPKAFVCTVSGTPGTWVSEGNL